MKTRYFAFAALLAGTAACGGSQALDSATEGATDAVTETAEEAVEEAVDEVIDTMMLRVINATDAELTMAIGATAIDAMAPGAYNQARSEALAGDDIELAGSVGVMAIAEQYSFAADGYYTVVAMGDSSGANGMPQVLVLEDDMTAPAAGQSLVRVVHAAVGAPNVAITIDGVGIAADLAYGAETGFHAGPAATTDVVVTVAGEQIATQSVAFTEGRLWTLIAKNDGESVSFVVVNEEGMAAEEEAPAEEAAAE